MGTTRTDSQKRLQSLFEAALQLPPAERQAFLDEVCGDDSRLCAELQVLLAREGRLQRLSAADRLHISDLFHAVFALSSDIRRRFLERACVDRPDLRKEIETLLAHAEDSGFLDQPAVLDATDSTDSTRLTSGKGTSLAGVAVDPMVGRKVRDYVILRKVGEGGMGVVYLALDTKLEKHVAIKVVRPDRADTADYRRRLESEAKLAAQLSHPNIATIHTLFDEGPDTFIVSEYVDGPSLREVISRGPLDYPRLIGVFTGIASGLEAAHARGIIHRDLKPDNVLLAEGDFPKIVDFGLAKSTATILRSTQLQSEDGSRPGTPAYMAPEQVDVSPARLDFRCDLFAFGVTLYEAATGINPFEGRSLWTTLDNIKRLAPPPLARPGFELGRLDAIVQRCLRKNPLERYESTHALVQDLKQLATGSGVHLPPPPRPPWTVWEVHQLAMPAVYASMLILLWLARDVAQPLWAGRTLAFASFLPGAVLIVTRLHLCYASRHRLPTLHQTLARVGRVLTWADGALSAILAAAAALMLTVDRPGTAAPLLILAVVNVVLLLVVEPPPPPPPTAPTGTSDPFGPRNGTPTSSSSHW